MTSTASHWNLVRRVTPIADAYSVRVGEIAVEVQDSGEPEPLHFATFRSHARARRFAERARQNGAKVCAWTPTGDDTSRPVSL